MAVDPSKGARVRQGSSHGGAKAEEAAAKPRAKGEKLDSAELGKKLAEPMKDAVYYRQGDYSAEYVSVPFGKDRPVTAANVGAAIEKPMAEFYKEALPDEDFDPAHFEAVAQSPAQAKAFLADVSKVSDDENDNYQKSGRAFGTMNDVLKANLTDLSVFKYGPKAGGEGDSVYLVVGKATDGNLAGYSVGAEG